MAMALCRTRLNGVLRCVQESCNGGSLREAIDEGCFARVSQCSWQRVNGVLQDIAAALEHAHARDLCHGSLTPSAIFLSVRCRRIH